MWDPDPLANGRDDLFEKYVSKKASAKSMENSAGLVRRQGIAIFA
jgi:hypothetical protein